MDYSEIKKRSVAVVFAGVGICNRFSNA